MKKINAVTAAFLAVSLALLTGCGAVGNVETNDEESFVEFNVDNASQQSEVSSMAVSLAPPVDTDRRLSETDTENGTDEEESSKPFVKRTIEGEPIDLAWFDDCVFMGDSVTNGLGLYNDYTGCFGNAQFVCGASLGWVNSQWNLFDENEVHPMYNGQKVLLEDAVMLTGANKAIIGMGMNDLGTYGIDATFEAEEEFLNKLREKSPGVEIYLMTVTPMIASKEYDRLNNPLIVEYDTRLESFASEHDCIFLNTWAAVVNDDGKLPDEICEDPTALGIHLNNEGCEMVKDYILRNVG